MVFGLSFWTRLVEGLSCYPDSPEKKLVAGIIARSLADEDSPKKVSTLEKPNDWQGGFGHGWLTPNLKAWCAEIEIQPDYLERQVNRVLRSRGAKA